MEEWVTKLENIKKKYGNPFSQTSFPKDSAIKDIIDNFRAEESVSTAGRIVARREHGKSCFMHIQDISGKIQLYGRLDVLGENKYGYFTQLDIGDIIGVKGELFKTRTGEITVLVKDFKLLVKSIRPLPEKWHGLKDKEVRYRQRYLDLISNNESRDIFKKRVEIINYIRKFFNDKGYFEVETPLLHVIPGGASGRPFVTHHNAMDLDVYLRIAPELYLKRLLVGGFDKVYEINKSFRNEGISTRHSPEFTMLEAYCAYKDYGYMMSLCESLISDLVGKIYNTTKLKYQDKEIEFASPWPRVSFAELFKQEFDVNVSDEQDVVLEKIKNRLLSRGAIKEGDLPRLTRSQILNIVEELIEKYYPQDQPVFVVDFFTWMSPLAKTKVDNPYIVERFELFIGGIEVANAYSELNDPYEQKKRFIDQLQYEDELPKKIDEDFLVSLEYGMPPATGLGIGIDRLIMIILNQPSIRDVILFPLLRPVDNV